MAPPNLEKITKMIYYEDIDSITVAMTKVMEEGFKALGIEISDDELDKVCHFMDEHFRDKYSCGYYANYN
jgi:hypothetical protein